VAINWADEHIPAILEAWYPGQAGGTAVANALFGLFNPGGRLPVTFYYSSSDLPPFDDYSMENRTYRYFTGETLYPFGFGLSYTTFSITNLQVSAPQVMVGNSVTVTVDVTNTGTVGGDEVVQLYIHQKAGSDSRPLRELKGFERLTLNPGGTKAVTFQLRPAELGYWSTNAGKWVQDAEAFDIWVGADSLATLHADLIVVL
jgi:beta-glucosidase